MVGLYIYIYIFYQKRKILILVKVQEKDERFAPQNIDSDQSKKTPLYTKLCTKITSDYLKPLNHKLQVSWVV